jgi:multidrug efflux pump subunit AcrB
MGLIGILLLFGIVKKNAIMMVDQALVRQRDVSRRPLRSGRPAWSAFARS